MDQSKANFENIQVRYTDGSVKETIFRRVSILLGGEATSYGGKAYWIYRDRGVPYISIERKYASLTIGDRLQI